MAEQRALHLNWTAEIGGQLRFRGEDRQQVIDLIHGDDAYTYQPEVSYVDVFPRDKTAERGLLVALGIINP